MEKVLIVSDSHGLTNVLNHLKQLYPTLPMIHCGDSELYLPHASIENMHIVRGNCDFDPNLPEEITTDIHGVTFYITHGHLYQVGRDLTYLSEKAATKNAQIVCYGHTHMARVEERNGLIMINPGSIHSPRDRVERTYAIVGFDQEGSIEVAFYTLDGRIVDDLSFKGILKKE